MQSLDTHFKYSRTYYLAYSTVKCKFVIANHLLRLDAVFDDINASEIYSNRQLDDTVKRRIIHSMQQSGNLKW